MDERRGQLSRRALLAEAGALGALASLGCRAATRDTPKAENPVLDVPRGSPQANDIDQRHRDATSSDALDEALERLAARGPAYAGGLANHAPMVAEALVVLGRSDAVISWIDTYAPRLEDWPRSSGRIAATAWSDALGKSERVTDWREFFTEEL